MKTIPLKRDLELLYEIGCFRFLQRNWKQFLNADFQNNSEHTFRVIWLALLIAKQENRGNHEKIIKMALVHDMAESRTGDLHYVSREYSSRDEVMGITDVLKNTSLETDLSELWHEYETRKSIEAKIVKDADNLDVDLELQEQEVRGHRLKEFWKDMRQHVYRHLYTGAAKKLFKEIQNSNPHDWHFHARNRYNTGDWRKK